MWYSRARVEAMRELFPKGCRVQLDEMNDKYAPPEGTRGTVVFVDDAATIEVNWDNGSRLGVVYGVDRCHIINGEDE